MRKGFTAVAIAVPTLGAVFSFVSGLESGETGWFVATVFASTSALKSLMLAELLS